ncbi:hypothetical protein Nmel_010309, partial [Mimus melanotis]
MESACTWVQGCSQLAEGWQPHPPAQEGGSWGVVSAHPASKGEP